MKKLILFTILILTSTLHSIAQDVFVTGTLTDETGAPMIGANVIVKGTQRGVVTDIDGKYNINAPVGSILVINYIGYLPIEMEVQADGSTAPVRKQRIKQKQVVPATQSQPQSIQHPYVDHNVSFESDTTAYVYHNPEQGVAVMGDGSHFRTKGFKRQINFNMLKSVKVKEGKHGHVYVLENNELKRYYKPIIVYSTSFSGQGVTSLPKLQGDYAQGRPINGIQAWQGPETGEPFAWGPKVTLFEYDGNANAYDKNGNLVPLSLGNGKLIKPYNPYDIFKKGMTYKNLLLIDHKIKAIKYIVSLKDNLQKGIIPGSKFHRQSAGLNINIDRDRFKMDGKANYSLADGKYTGSSPFGFHFMRAVMLTPPTFDNSYGLGNEAINKPVAYELENGFQRNASNGVADNPYWLLNHSVDKMGMDRFSGVVKFEFQLFSNHNFKTGISYDKNNSETITAVDSGSEIFTQGIYNQREELIESWKSYGIFSGSYNNN